MKRLLTSTSRMCEVIIIYFPDDMTFQYFFFDTYPGYFLQALPFVLIAGVVYGIIRHHKSSVLSKSKRFWSVLFACYLTGLICLVLALDVMGIIWYLLLYHMPSGRVLRRECPLFQMGNKKAANLFKTYYVMCRFDER